MSHLAVALTLFVSAARAGHLAPIIGEEAVRHNVDPFLVAAVIQKESGFNSRACYKGAHGLMQVQRKSRTCLKETPLFDDRKNIRRGIKLMSWFKRYCESKNHTGHHWLLHYNQGIRVRTTGKIGGYARRVLKIYWKLKKKIPENNT